MQTLDPSTYRHTRWKNGGGATTEAFTLPAGATLDTFDLRVSLARVEADGPFSEFHGIDRTLVVTEGAGLTLATADGAHVTLDTASPPFAFTGDDPVHATLREGAVADLNVMTRRSAMQHTATRIVLEDARSLDVLGELTLLVVLEGAATLAGDGVDVAIDRGDIVVLSRDESLVARSSSEETPATLLLIDVFRRA